MAMGRPKAELSLSEDERMQLTSLARSRSLPAGLVQRASLVLACADGVPNSAVAKRFGVTNATVGKWRRRFVEQRIAGLHDELRPGKPRSIDDERIAGLLTTTLHQKPKDGATHWSVRGLGACLANSVGFGREGGACGWVGRAGRGTLLRRGDG
jgi:putative transposase